MPDPDIVIETSELTRRFGHFTAVDRLTFDVRKGEIFGLLGPNGAGKSTTLRMLCGLLASTSGTARVGGFEINRQPEQLRQSIGYMSQRFSLYRDLTVAENIAFFGGVYGLNGDRLATRARTALRLASLEGMENLLTGSLSGAIQQRLALGCAILHEPSILFLDEPTSGVDPLSRRLFWELIQGMSAAGVTILVTTHFMDEAEFCDRIGLISGGRLAALASPRDIKRLVDEDLFEVSAPELTRAADAARGLSGVRAASCFGAKLHVFCDRGSRSADSLATELRSRGLTIRAVTTADVSLEDAFIRLVSREEVTR